MADAQIKAVITAKDEASSVVSGFTHSLENATAGSFALLGGLALVGVALGASVAAFNESEQATTQLDAVLRSTAGAAGWTRDQAISLSKALEKQTTYSDEAVLSVENLLLTFTAISKDIMPQATETVLNMATALGEDTKSASIQLGKALQDPILGITALRRVGVNFSDAQKTVIQNLVDTGKKAEAQQMILKELNTEFGGSATAAAQTFAGAMKQLGNAINDIMESIGALVVHALDPLIGGILTWIDKAGGADAIGQKLIDGFDKMQKYIPIVIGAILGGLVPAFYAMGSAMAPLIPFIAAGAAIGLVVKLIIDHFGGWDNTMKAMQPTLNWLKGVWDEIVKVWNEKVLPAIKAVWDWLQKHIFTQENLNKAIQFAKDSWNTIVKVWNEYVFPALKVLWGLIVQYVWPALQMLWDVIVNQLIPTIVDFWNKNKSWLIPTLEALAAIIGVVLFIAIGFIIGAFAVVIVVITAVVWVVKLLIQWWQFLIDIVNNVANAFGNLVGGWIQRAINDFNALKNIVEQVANAIGALMKGDMNGVSSALHNLHVPGFATGVQDFSGGIALVGEKGPELVNLPRGSDVIPNDKLKSVGGGTVNVTVQAGAFMGTQQDARKYAMMIGDALKDVANAKNTTVAEMLT